MFTTQISIIESQRQAILAKIEELSRQEQALVQESLQYREMEDEAVSLLGAIASLKDKFSNHKNASSALFTEISKLFQQPPTEPDPQPEEWENLVEDEEEEVTTSVEATTVDDGQLDIFTAIDCVEAATANRYESAAEIAAALADEDEVDTHLMAIASILDSCPAIEIPGRAWFFVQNIPADFDDRILGYLPKSIRPEWDKQRTAMESEARASIFSEVSTAKPAFEVGDFVQDYTGQVCEIVQAEDIGGRVYVEVQSPKGKETYRDSDLKAIENVEQEARESILPPTQMIMPNGIGVGDLVECPDGKVGHISEIEFTIKAGRIATVILPGGSQKIPALELRYIGKYQEPHQGAISEACCQGQIAQPKAAKSRKPKKTAATPSEILKCKDWAEIRAIANNDPALIKETATAAHTKAEKELIENLPELIRDYMYESRDFSDMDWLPNYIKQRVQFLMSEPGTAA